MILESIVVASGIYALYKNNTHVPKDIKDIKKRWYELMEGCKAENKGEDKETFKIYSINKNNWGYDLQIEIPAGKTFEELEKLKPIIEVGYPCNVEITRPKLSKCTNVKLIIKDFSDNDFKPIKLKPNEILLGYDLLNKEIKVDMNKFPHVLVAGMPGQGKSRLLLIILTNLIYSFNNDLEIYLLSLSKNDLKKLSSYKPIKKFSKDLHEIKGIYSSMDQQREKRETIIDKAGVDNIEEYNRGKNKLPYIYVFADEFSAYMPDDSDTDTEKEDKKICLALLKKLIKLGRSSGVFIILGIQVSTYEEMPTIIRRCCNVKITFKQSDTISSNAIIGNGEAVTLQQQEFIILTDNHKRCKTPTIDLNIIHRCIGMPKAENKPITSNKTIEAVFIPNKEPIKKEKVIDYSSYGQFERGRKKERKGVIKNVGTEG